MNFYEFKNYEWNFKNMMTIEYNRNRDTQDYTIIEDNVLSEIKDLLEFFLWKIFVYNVRNDIK